MKYSHQCLVPNKDYISVIQATHCHLESSTLTSRTMYSTGVWSYLNWTRSTSLQEWFTAPFYGWLSERQGDTKSQPHVLSKQSSRHAAEALISHCGEACHGIEEAEVSGKHGSCPFLLPASGVKWSLAIVNGTLEWQCWSQNLASPIMSPSYAQQPQIPSSRVAPLPCSPLCPVCPPPQPEVQLFHRVKVSFPNPRAKCQLGCIPLEAHRENLSLASCCFWCSRSWGRVTPVSACLLEASCSGFVISPCLPLMKKPMVH